jgi:probable FeS assembly SUF system protein SufT
MSQPRAIAELPDDCAVTLIPSGMSAILHAGDQVMVTQALGGSITVQTPTGHLARIEARDLRRMGLEGLLGEPEEEKGADPLAEFSMDAVTEQLRTVFDPEIPINVVDLGLIYRCEAIPVEGGGNRISIDMTMTAPGCGMGDILAEDVKAKLLRQPGVAGVEVNIVFDPPWGMEKMSETAKIELGLY